MLPLIALLASSCVYRINHETRPVEVQAQVDLVVLQVDAGEIRLSADPDLTGVSGTAGTVLAKTGAGDVFGNGIASPILEVDTGAGSIDLIHVQSPDRLWVEAGAGDIDLLVPAGTYAVDADSGTGPMTVAGITQDDHASASIKASTGAGSIMITGYTPGTES